MSAYEVEAAVSALEANLARLLDARLLEFIVGADPAAGAENSMTVPGGEIWEIVGYLVTLLTDATVSNRRPVLVIDDGTTDIYHFGSQANQVATTTSRQQFKSGSVFTANAIAGGHNLIGIGDVTCLSGWRIRTVTENLQAGDNYGPAVIAIRRYSPSDLTQLSDSLLNELLATAGLRG